MKFEILLTIRDDYNSPDFKWNQLQMEKVEGDSFVEVLSKFLITVAKVEDKLREKLKEELEVKAGYNNDDIPF